METSTTPSFNLSHACRRCQSPALQFCGHCRSSYYCSFECRNLDWQSHKIFCSKREDKEFADQRRKACLSTIQDSAFTIFFLERKFQGKKMFILLKEKKVCNLVFAEKEILQGLDIYMDDRAYSELKFELIERKKNKESIVVYDCVQKPFIFTLGSDDLNELRAAVDKMPSELSDSIFNAYFDEKIKSASPETLMVSLFAVEALQRKSEELKKSIQTSSND